MNFWSGIGAALLAIIQLAGLVIFKFYGWVPIVIVLFYLTLKNRRREQWIGESEVEHMLLLIEVPKDNDKKELSAEQMFASLHGILRPQSDLKKEGVLQEHISFEIASVGNRIQFYVWVPVHLKDFVEGQIYAQYPSVRIAENPTDYAGAAIADRSVAGTELRLNKNAVMPIKTFQSFEVDPLAGITAVLAKMDHPGEEMWVQILARPIEDDWQDKSFQYIDDVKNGKTPSMGSTLIRELIALPVYVLVNFFGALFSPPEAKKEEKKTETKLSTGQQAIVKAVEEKAVKLGYQVLVRVAYLGPDPDLADQRMQAIIGAFKQYNTTNLNGFVAAKQGDDEDIIEDYRTRAFGRDGDTLNIEELASLYHLPHTTVETPNMVWNTAKTGEPPANLPVESEEEAADISLFGLTTFRGEDRKFGIKRRDRGRHVYIIGQTGAGKSGLLNLLALSDVYHNQGMAIVDPHGDFATDMLKFIPEERLKDVIYFNPADVNNPVAFNPLEVTDPNFKNNISSEVVGVMKRMFDSWGPRLEYILRYTILALLDYPDSTMLGITRMLTEKDFRKKVIKEIKDPVVKNFWVNEFASWNDKFANEAVAPILNKVGAFVANPLVRNIIGQPKSSFDVREVMDEGKILVVNLSRGLMGEDNAAILGALMVTKIQLSAMSRADSDLATRRPFYLYVDEFQNFATDSFAVILSEARKYGLMLTVANQYVSQMPETVRDAVFGNVGSMVTFRVGAEDANVIGKYFAPVFEPDDLIKIDNRSCFVSMSIDGNKTLPFSAKTLQLPQPEHDQTAKIVEMSRQTYSKPLTQVEQDIERWMLGSGEGHSGRAGEAPAAHSMESLSGQPHTDDQSEQKPKGILGELKNPEPRAQSANRGNSSRSSDRDRNRPRGNDNRGGRSGGNSGNRSRSQSGANRDGERRHNSGSRPSGGQIGNQHTTAAPKPAERPTVHHIQGMPQGQEVHLRGDSK